MQCFVLDNYKINSVTQSLSQNTQCDRSVNSGVIKINSVTVV